MDHITTIHFRCDAYSITQFHILNYTFPLGNCHFVNLVTNNVLYKMGLFALKSIKRYFIQQVLQRNEKDNKQERLGC
jgi:hypothetical protein